MSAAAARRLSAEELEHLRVAGEWGMLRDLSGTKVCLTGSMSMKRDQLAVLVEAAGGVFTNTMNSTVRLLVVAASDWYSEKVRAAEGRGVRVMTEEQFVEALTPSPRELLTGQRMRFDAGGS